ncbi:hypothetical protein [Muriicola sp.]|uniref:hypothetical protein n=1 Tax=Muriicola sp. TaxID=2020856 RepID=UPI003C71ACCA
MQGELANPTPDRFVAETAKRRRPSSPDSYREYQDRDKKFLRNRIAFTKNPVPTPMTVQAHISLSNIPIPTPNTVKPTRIKAKIKKSSCCFLVVFSTSIDFYF